MSQLSAMERLKNRRDITPDFPQMKEINNIPVFVYGTLKKGLSNHRLVEDSYRIVNACILPGGFTMSSAGGFPVLHRKKSAETSYKIEGEIYLVDPVTLTRLDGLEANGIMYQRELIEVRFFENCIPKKEKAWVYIGVDEYWDGYKELPKVEPIQATSEAKVLDWYPNSQYASAYRDRDNKPTKSE